MFPSKVEITKCRGLKGLTSQGEGGHDVGWDGEEKPAWRRFSWLRHWLSHFLSFSHLKEGRMIELLDSEIQKLKEAKKTFEAISLH